MGAGQGEMVLFLFSFFLSSRFSCFLTPQVFYSLLCTVPRWYFLGRCFRERGQRVKFGDGRPVAVN
ncbi:hypothetical protein M438DRAFT_159083 [Aureobasidium pullulans EXF-150]|uniref:Uncharacterized protein n=1 Tax=Aureobasidium pullulans EXF-150 TaxID=1043002 RepID=A0A074XN29_AURPU|nr:uncharacterized protein M438DRAFT_159083 [Aureobasidium pullulans EXF-150]KEQ86925.1 hypothetical protein M438DRAFT_159083 [Aureobasidium pullulans EXF-150]